MARASRAWIRPGQIGGNRREQSAGLLSELGFRAKVKSAFFDRASVRRSMDQMMYDCLYKAGLDVKQAAKKGIGNAAPKQTKAGQRAVRAGEVVEFAGGLYRDLTMVASGKPRPPGKPAKSWAPKRWLYNSVIDRMERGVFGPTAVVGTYRTPWLAQLHEFGGTMQLTAWRMGVGAARNAYLRKRGNGRQGRDERGRWTSALPQKNQYEYGALIWSHKKPRFGRWDQTTIKKTARYPARPFMQGAAGVQKALAKANLKFRNALRKAS